MLTPENKQRRAAAPVSRQFVSFVIVAVLILQHLLIISPITAEAAIGSPVSITALDTSFTQNFDSLAGGTPISFTPDGWDFTESGTNANTVYTVGTGSGTSGDTYSFGASASSERAFGGLRSGSLVPIIGATFTNNTGSTINSLTISYTGEQWRQGVTNRGAADRLDFQISTNAANLTTGTYNDVNALDFSSPNTTAAAGALDGNLAINRTAISSTITGLSVANGAIFFIRWIDFDIASSDDGLAIDDFSITATGTTTPSPSPTITTTPTPTATATPTPTPTATPTATPTPTPTPAPIATHVVISQVYGGGGNSGALYTNDFVELYNPTGSAVNLAGWSLQYASATGSGWDSGKQPLGGVIGPSEYYLVSLASGGATGQPLPAANISGELNLSGTAGKIALVGNGDSLDGNCPLNDADVVDFVGYGTTANCSEGDSDAPAPSNTNAIFRQFSGSQDTNVNGTDFFAQIASPRRTAPIVEIGPAVLSTDPRSNFSNSPRDSSLTITFTEPIYVDPQWFTVNCAVTGAHNDATIASYNNGKNYVITPNVNFQAGEQCSVTISKDSVHDQDLDDSAPDTDTLTANYSWSFTIATGAAPAYSPDVHLTMGNPTDAAANVSEPNNYLMEKPEFALSYNRDRGTPNWVSWHLDDSWVGSLARVDTFRPDPAVPSDWYRVQATDYFSSGFDRGHMVPNADRDPATSIPINQATFLMTNMIPQAPDNNQGPWANMENYLRTLLPANEVYIVAGGAGTGGTGSTGGVTTTFAEGRVTVPAQTWKVALVIPKDSGDDIARVTSSARTIAVIMPNVQGIRNNAWTNYLTSIDQVEALTGYDFYENLPDAIENSVEGGIDGNNPPGTANQVVNVAEDNSVSITLDAAGAGNLTYEVVNQPTNGSLSGSGATRNYTPNPDFNGTDSFTFRVNDGQRNSNTSTVSINVTEVNDAPVAGNDSVIIAEDSAANAVNVLANDTDTDGDTLTVLSKTAGMNGTVVITGGGTAVTYTPAANFNGSDSFTYTVSDGRGGTQTATVSVTVTPINDAPAFISITPLSQGVDYSDTVQPITITVADIDDVASSLLVTATGLPNGLTLAQTPGIDEWTVSGRADVPAGTYQVQLKVTDSLGAITVATTPVTLTVAKEKTATDYNGDFALMTAGPANNTATVRLAAKLTQDNDGSAGDITEATVTFKIYKFNATTASYTVANVPVNASGEALTTYTLPADTYSISVDVDSNNGYWTADPINLGLLNITVPSDEQRSSGGGWVTDAASASGKANLAFSVSATRNGQPKGNVSFSFKGADGFNYLVKGNSWQGGYLQFSAEPGVTPAVYTGSNIKGSCNVQKIDPTTGLVVASFGNYTFEIFTRDGDLLNPRRGDSYSITVRDNSNAVFHQVGSPNSLITLGGGNITNKAR